MKKSLKSKNLSTYKIKTKILQGLINSFNNILASSCVIRDHNISPTSMSGVQGRITLYILRLAQ